MEVVRSFGKALMILYWNYRSRCIPASRYTGSGYISDELLAVNEHEDVWRHEKVAWQ